MSNLNKFKDFLKNKGYCFEIKEFPFSTHTSTQAAAAIGCDISQIAKSIVFKGKDSQKPILVIVSGKNRVDEKKLEILIGEKIEKADPVFVLETTGFLIGGVPPFGHKQKIKTFIDKDLLKFSEIWAAAGDKNSVFRLTPEELIKISQGEVISIN